MQVILLGIFLVYTTSAYDLNIAIEKSGGGVYYRFWFVYIVLAATTSIILIISTSVSMCRRYKIVANQGEEISELQ